MATLIRVTVTEEDGRQGKPCTAHACAFALALARVLPPCDAPPIVTPQCVLYGPWGARREARLPPEATRRIVAGDRGEDMELPFSFPLEIEVES